MNGESLREACRAEADDSSTQAEKAERNAQKADEQAIKHHSKAVGAEHKANKDLERAQAKHDQGEIP